MQLGEIPQCFWCAFYYRLEFKETWFKFRELWDKKYSFLQISILLSFWFSTINEIFLVFLYSKQAIFLQYTLLNATANALLLLLISSYLQLHWCISNANVMGFLCQNTYSFHLLLDLMMIDSISTTIKLSRGISMQMNLLP